MDSTLFPETYYPLPPICERPLDSLVAQTVKNLPVMQETWVRSLGQEDPLEKEMATPLQYSCLENSIDRGAWQATVHGVEKSQTRLRD